MAHALFAFFVPVILVNTVQLIGGVFIVINSEKEGVNGGVDDDGYEVVLENKCVPIWVFAAVFQPLISIAMYIIAYGNLNLAIERDVDQDIVEMNIRLTYSDNHVRGTSEASRARREWSARTPCQNARFSVGGSDAPGSAFYGADRCG